MTDREVMQQALEALENAVRYHGIMLMADPPQAAWKYHRVEDNAKQAITSLRKALEQPEQEPVRMPCIGKDPRCPCQDGDACHYKDCGGTKAWPVPQAESVGEVVEVNNDGFKCEFSQRLAVGTKLYTFPPAAQPEQEPVTCRFCHDKKGSWTWQCYKCGEIDDVQQPAPLPS